MKIKDFIIFPRQVYRDWRSGALTHNEFMVYSYIRLGGNPYGISTISLENVRNDVFRGRVDVNYCNKIILDLRRKRYLYYYDRQGRRGTFEVHLDAWSMPNKKIKTLDAFWNGTAVRSSHPQANADDADLQQTLPIASQKLVEGKNQLLRSLAADSDSNEVRGSNNDTETHTKTNNKRSVSFLGMDRLVRTPNFQAMNAHEFRCKEIATELREPHINPMLTLLRSHSMTLLEEAFGIYREDAKHKTIKRPGAYFTGIVELIASKHRDRKAQ